MPDTLDRACRKLRLLPVYFAFLTTFGLAAFEKWRAGSVPEWFEKQFADTILNSFPGSLTANFYLLAVLETVVTFGFLVSLARLEFLPARPKSLLKLSLLLGALVFGMLGFGQRLTHGYGEAATLFFYFSGTLITILFVEKGADEAVTRH